MSSAENDPSMDIAKFLNAQETAELSWLKMASDVSDGSNNLFVNDWPPVAGADSAVLLVRYEGEPPTEVFGNPLLIRHPRVQVTVRAKLSTDALKWAGQIMKALVVVKDQNLNGHKYSRITPVGEPFEIGPDSTNRQQAVLNLKVDYYDTP